MPPSQKRTTNDVHADDNDDDFTHHAKRGRGGTSSFPTTTTTTTASKSTTSSATTSATSPGEFLVRGANNLNIGSPNANGGTSTGSVAIGGSGSVTGGSASQGRIVRKSKYNAGLAKLDTEMYEHAKSEMLLLQDSDAAAATTTATTSTAIITSKKRKVDESAVLIQRHIIDQYVFQSTQLNRRYNRNYGDVIVFGYGDVGQLGMGWGITEARTPRILVNLRGKSMNMLACGGLHSVALTEEGSVYSWGCSDEGTLGWKTTEELDGAYPSKVVGFFPSRFGPNGGSPPPVDDSTMIIDSTTGKPKREEAIITLVAAGETQSLALSSVGDVYMWGTYKDTDNRSFKHMPPADDTRTPTGYKDMNKLEKNEDPMWYHPPRGSQDWPLHIVDMPQRAKDISAGRGVNAALLEDDTLVTWGMGDKGELARPVPNLDKETPMEIVKSEYLMPKPPLWDGPTLLDRKVLSMACGEYHLLVVTKELGELNVYSSGLNNYGQLGHGDNENRSILTKVEDLVGCEITKVEAGLQFSCFVDKTGRELYSCGRGDYGQLGVTLDQPKEGYGEFRPCRVPIVYEPKEGTVSDPKKNCINVDDIIEEDQPIIEQISCGATHVLVLTNGGDAYSWGFGEMGACGHGKSIKDTFRPKKIVSTLVKSQGASNYTFQHVSGGGQHSGAIVKTGSTGFVS
ncbi:hypothetical protein ACHAWU_003740 [Discostella pseudostelligera]|uniref:RCC1-like domain-containing protein n=1 Tax=Discostella pseudostelligera TaxID=259834 RepID=A0ABD3N692_9STRA